MAKIKIYEISQKERYKIIGDFFEIISRLRSKKEVIDFFVGLLSSSETLMMARRIQTAQMLLEGNNYEEIRNSLKVSFQTITKTDQWLHSEDDRYNLWLSKCLKCKKGPVSKTPGENMLDKYVHHRIIKNLLD